MAPRKRIVTKKGDAVSQEQAENLIRAAKARAKQSSVGSKFSSPMMVILILVVVLSISLGLYVYMFVDVNSLIGKLQGLQQNSETKDTNIEKPITKDSLKEMENEKNQEPKEKKEPEKKAQSSPQKTKKESSPKYSKHKITNSVDNKIRQELDKADDFIEKKNPAEAIKVYDKILKKYPKSPRATYGKAKALCEQAEMQRSNDILEQCIAEYTKVLDLPEVPKELMLQAGRECAERQQFRGWSGRAAKTLRRLIEFYPDEYKLWNELGVQFLVSGRNEDAREAFKHVLRADSNNGFAKTHLGFILKTVDNDHDAAIPYLEEGIASEQPGVIDGRFFLHLGDALFRTGKHDKALSVYKSGAERGLFLSMYQRSLYNVDSLTGRPWWTVEQTGHATELRNLEQNWKTIRDEGLSQLDPKTGSFLPEEENLREKGDWKQFTLFQKGRKNEANCKKVPKTCALIEKIPDAAGCKRGQVKFSVMQPGVHVWPHCGPTNCRIRAHLGLVIPEGPLIRVADDKRTWKEGEFIIFDDSFEHEVWHKGTKTRLVLIVDLWHPELTPQQKRNLSPI